MGAGLEAPAFLQPWTLLLMSGIICGHVNGPNAAKIVKEGSEFILSCSSLNKDLRSELFDWKKDGHIEVFMYDAGIHYNNGQIGQDHRFQERVSHFPDELKDGNASIKISNAEIDDSGIYTCVLPHLRPNSPTLNSIEVIVERIFKDRSGEILGASPKPYMRICDATVDMALLQCDVEGAFPKPKVEWKDGAGNILPAGNLTVTERNGCYHVKTFTNVTNTGHVRCVVTQEEIHHETFAETYVFVSGKACEDSSKICLLVISPFTVILALVVLLMCIKKHGSCWQQNSSEAADEVSPDTSVNSENKSLCSAENGSSNH